METAISIPESIAYILPLLFGYLCGSIPFGLLITKFAGAGDVRKIGSGNIGATNVLRTGNKGLAALTLLSDALKGTIAVLVVHYFTGSTPLAALAGFAAFIGHLYPVWLKFKGGKGIATYLGVALAFWWQGIAAFVIVWIAIAYLFRYSSLAALGATTVVPIAFLLADRPIIALLFFAMTALAWVKHKENISRLLAGTESKIGAKDSP